MLEPNNKKGRLLVLNVTFFLFLPKGMYFFSIMHTSPCSPVSMRLYSNPCSFQKYLFLEGISLGVAILLLASPKPLCKSLALMLFPNKNHGEYQGPHWSSGLCTYPGVFLWLLSSQRRVLLTDKCSPVMNKKTSRGREAWLLPLLLSAPEQTNMGCTRLSAGGHRLLPASGL